MSGHFNARRQVLAAGIAVSVAFAGISAFGTGPAAAQAKVPNSSKLEKEVKKLVGGEIDVSNTVEREKVYQEIRKLLVKDKKGVALRTPAWWAQTIQENQFGKRKSGQTKKVIVEDMDVGYADGTTGQAPIAYHGAAGYLSKNAHKLIVSVLPKGTDPKTWLEANWKADEVAAKNWIVAAVSESDKFPISDQPFVLAHAFGHMLANFNTDANQWFLEGVGDACGAVQKVACENMPDRLAGLILRDPKGAITNVNSSRFDTYVLFEGEKNDVAAKYQEISAERNVAASNGEGAGAALSAWVEGHTGRTLPSSYDFVTATEEERVVAGWTGSMYLVSPAKRGEAAAFKVTYDKEASSVSIDGTNVGEFIVYMNDDLVDLDNPITISCNGTELETRVFERGVAEIFETADTFGEYGRVFTTQFRGFAPAEIKPADDAEDGGDGADKADGADKGDGEKKDGE